MKQKHTKDTINLASTCTSESEQEYEMKLELNKDEDLYVTAKVISTRVNHSEGYGTEDGLTDCEMRHSFTEDESDVDADVEDTESRLKNTETLQRTCLKRKRKHKLIKQDTTESEEDVGQRTAPRRWNLHLSPCKAIQNVKEESISQMRPLLLKGYKKAAAKQPCKKLQDIEKSYPFTLLKFSTIPLLFALFLIPIGVVLMMYIL